MESWEINRRIDKISDQLADIYDQLRENYKLLGEAIKNYNEFLEASKNNGNSYSS